ncbi:hypothetical protein [Brevibacillus fulvus]|uniref:Uncharacterized protein n=1 Tax=Brevibacillus fulvus TaxID=1125967 RepID=A0A938Y4P3_9BACL|nr:hypothetical protein [Brevibacillus fulvus]MBM7592244.1 hypothetical protein [Brevibacillus fulvus]
MLTDYALERQTNALDTLFTSAEIEINGMTKTMELLKIRNSASMITFLIRVPENETGLITKRIIRDREGVVIWQDNVEVNKGIRELALSIPIELKWKVGETN